MQITNCLVIIKQTAMAQGGRAATFARKGDETAKRLLHSDAEHKRAVDAVRRALKSRKIAFADRENFAKGWMRLWKGAHRVTALLPRPRFHQIAEA